MTVNTADLCDQYSNLSIAQPLFGDFGGKRVFSGEISTIKCFEDNSLVRAALEGEGRGGVLVIDGGGSLRCALIGDQLAALAIDNGWAGLIVNGCIRDSSAMAALGIGCKALASHPLKSTKRGAGEPGLTIHFADIDFTPGHYLYADSDGIVVSAEPLQVD